MTFLKSTNLAKLLTAAAFFALGTFLHAQKPALNMVLYEYDCTPTEKTVQTARGATTTMKSQECKDLRTSVALVVSSIVLVLYTVAKGLYFMALNLIRGVRGQEPVSAKTLDPDSQPEPAVPAPSVETKAPEVKT